MSDIRINAQDTHAIKATLPRDLTNASVTFLFTNEENPYTAVIKDAGSGKVAAPISAFDPDEGVYEIKWQVEFSDGTTEILPKGNDTLKVLD